MGIGVVMCATPPARRGKPRNQWGGHWEGSGEGGGGTVGGSCRGGLPLCTARRVALLTHSCTQSSPDRLRSVSCSSPSDHHSGLIGFSIDDAPCLYNIDGEKSARRDRGKQEKGQQSKAGVLQFLCCRPEPAAPSRYLCIHDTSHDHNDRGDDVDTRHDSRWSRSDLDTEHRAPPVES